MRRIHKTRVIKSGRESKFKTKVIHINFKEGSLEGFEGYKEDKTEERLRGIVERVNKLSYELNPNYYQSIGLDIEEDVKLTVYTTKDTYINQCKERIKEEIKLWETGIPVKVYINHESLGGEQIEESFEVSKSMESFKSSKIVRMYIGISFYGKRINKDSYIELINQRGVTTESGEDILNSRDTLEDELLGYARDVLGRV